MPLLRRFLLFALPVLAPAVVLLGPTAIVLSPCAASAQDQQDPEPEVSVEESEEAEDADVWSRLLALSLVGGWNTPWGVFGANLDIAPLRWLVIYVGGGATSQGQPLNGPGTSRLGWRATTGLKGRAPVGNGAVGLSSGISFANFQVRSDQLDEDDNTVQLLRSWDVALFWHIALSFEYRFDHGLLLSAFVGADQLVADIAGTTCIQSAGGECRIRDFGNPTSVFIGGSLGYALDL